MRDTMALQLRRTASMRVRLVTTLIAAFAFIVQPYVGIIASQNVNALAATPSIVNLDTYFVKSIYRGIATDITVNNLTDANGVKVGVSRTGVGSITKTAKTSVLNTLNTGSSATVTAPIVIQSGSYSEAGSGSWNMPAGSLWTSATTPTSVTVTITRDGGPDLTATKTINPIMGTFATLAEVMPTPAVSTSSTTFVNDPKYVRENNGGDLTAQLVTPDSTTDVRFFVDGNVSAPIAGSNVGGAGATTSWWRLNTPLAAGEHTISAEVKIADQWYPVSDTGIIYSLDTPTATYVLPNDTKNVFRPSDNPVRVKADDQFNQFKSMDVKIGATTHTILRADCDLRAAGNYVLCDVDTSSTWTNLSEGVHAAVTSVKTQANNRLDGLTSRRFTIDGTAPQMLNVAIVSPTATSIYRDSVVLAHYVKETGQLNGVEFYVTKLRADGQCDPNAPKVLSSQSAQFVNHNSANDTWYYRTTVDTSSLNGVNCIFSVAEDAAGSHSNPQVKKFSANFDNTAPSVPVNGTPHNTAIKTNNFYFNWDESTDTQSTLVKYEFRSSLDESQVGAASDASSAWKSGILNEAKIHSTGAGDGTWYWQVRAIDSVGNKSAWSQVWNVTLDQQKPTVEITSPNNGDPLKGTVSVKMTASDSNLTAYSYRIHKVNADNTNTADSAVVEKVVDQNVNSFTDQEVYSWNTKNTSDGKYYVYVSARDTAGNRSEQRIYVTVDNASPAVNITAPTKDSQLQDTITVTGTARDLNGIQNDEVIVHLRKLKANGNCDGFLNTLTAHVDSNGNWTTSFDSSAFDDGKYCITVLATDVVGNGNGGGVTLKSFSIDNTAPSVTNYAYSNNSSLTRNDVTVTITTSESVDTPTDWTRVDDMHFTRVFEHNGGFTVSLTDKAGNTATVGGKLQGAEVKGIDRNTPVISGITEGATVSGPVYLSVFDPKYEGADGFDASTGLNVDGNSVVTTPGANKTYLYEVTMEGPHTVFATDKAGNVTDVLHFTIDSIAPTLTVNQLVASTNTTPTITGTTTDKDSDVFVDGEKAVIDAANPNVDGTYNWSVTLPARALGSYTPVITSTDTINPVTTAAPMTFEIIASQIQEEEESTEDTPAEAGRDAESFTTADVIATPTILIAGLAGPITAVLGVSNTNTDTTDQRLAAVDQGDVKGTSTTGSDTDTNKQAEAGCGTFLGICWYWWIPIVLAAILAAYYLFRPRREEV